jgi:hypothetical protein
MKTITFWILTLVAYLTHAQTVVTLQGMYLRTPVALDSILLQNLSRPSAVALAVPPSTTASPGPITSWGISVQ